MKETVVKIKKKKPSDSIKLILLPPEEHEEVTFNDVKNFYVNLTSILMSEN